MARGRFNFRTSNASMALRLMPWTPSRLGTDLLWWVDAMDARTLTVGGTPTRVSQINDKSGNSNHLVQATFSAQPNLVASSSVNSINGRQCLQFESSRGTSLRNLTLGLRAHPFTYCMMLCTPPLITDFVSSGMIMASADTAAGTRRALLNFFIDLGGTGDTFFNHFAGIGGGPSVALSAKTNYVVTAGYNGASSESSVNGVRYGTYDVGSEPYNGIELGAWNGGGNSSNVFIGEAFIVNGILAQSRRQLIEGYLAWKWGHQASLPANHPYRNVLPRGTPLT